MSFTLPYISDSDTDNDWKLAVQIVPEYGSYLDHRVYKGGIQFLVYEKGRFSLKWQYTDKTKEDLEEKLVSKMKTKRNFGSIPIFVPPFLEEGAEIIPFSFFSSTTFDEEFRLSETKLNVKCVMPHIHESDIYVRGAMVQINKTNYEKLALCLFNQCLIGYIPAPKSVSESKPNNESYNLVPSESDQKPKWKEFTMLLQYIDEVKVCNKATWKCEYPKY